jgi:hypothetical protein
MLPNITTQPEVVIGFRLKFKCQTKIVLLVRQKT